MGWPKNVACANTAFTRCGASKSAGEKNRGKNGKKNRGKKEVKRLTGSGRAIRQGACRAAVFEYPVIDHGQDPADQAGPQDMARVMRAAQHLCGTADQPEQESRDKYPPAPSLRLR